MEVRLRRVHSGWWPILILLLGCLSTTLYPVLARQNQASPALSETERKIAGAVDLQMEDALALLRRSVSINSGTMNLEGVRAVGEVFRSEFEALGFGTEWFDGEAFNRAGHLVASHPGSGPGILLIGHLDTVFEPDSPFQEYELISAAEVRGPGVIDMKGGLVVMLSALRALDEVGLLDHLNLTVVLTGDEEKAGRPLELSRKVLKEAARDATFALGFEDGDGNPSTAVISRRGASSWKLSVTGTPAHSSQIFQPEVGAGAIFEAARVLHSFRKQLGDENLLTLNPGLILGGTTFELEEKLARGSAFGKENVVAEHTIVTGDLRAISSAQLERVRRQMRSIVETPLLKTNSKITFDEGYPPLAPSEGNKRLLALYDQTSRDLGLGTVTAVDPRNAGAADISFTEGLVEFALDGLGLMGKGGHTVQETADLRTLPTQTTKAAILIYRLSQGSLR